MPTNEEIDTLVRLEEMIALRSRPTVTLFSWLESRPVESAHSCSAFMTPKWLIRY